MIISILVGIDVFYTLPIAIQKPIQSLFFFIYNYLLVHNGIMYPKIVEGFDEAADYHRCKLQLKKFMFIILHVIVDM